MASRRTRLVRMYAEDIEDIDIKFPNVRKADFIRMAVRTNPLLQIEANIRKIKVGRGGKSV